jgi:transcriptional regulator with XRE-family HTH domain
MALDRVIDALARPIGTPLDIAWTLYSVGAILGSMKGNHLVREARKRAGLTQAELAARAGTTQSAIARLERGATTPTLETISKLVRAAGFDLTIGMANTDDDHDWSLLQQNLALTPTQRVRKNKKALEFMMELREAGRAAGVSRR